MLAVLVALASVGCASNSSSNHPISNSTSDATSSLENSVDPKDTPHKIGVVEIATGNAIAISEQYFSEYLAPYYNCEFVFSEACSTADDVITFMENCADMGVEAIICNYNYDTEQLTQKAADLGMYFCENLNRNATSEAAYTGGYDNFCGTFAANQASVATLFHDWIVDTPMILGLAMTLVYECISYSVNSQQGVVLFGKPGVEILSNIPFILLVLGLLFLFTIYIFQYSEFGYKRRAIQGSQKLANEAGINIYTNCIGCYAIAGCIAAISGVFNAAYQGSLAPVLGMSSNTQVFASMFPMTLGAWIGSFCGNQSLGVFVGSLAVRLMIQGLARLGLGSTTQNLIVYSLFLIFVVINTNKRYPSYLKAKKKRIALAQKTRLEKGI